MRGQGGGRGWRSGRAAIAVFASCIGSLFAFSALAQEDLPEVKILQCISACANSSKAVPIEKPKGSFPRLDMEGSYVEGFVVVRYTIGTDGHVRDVAVARPIGPKEFADAATSAVGRWVFKPAEADGKPVEQISSVQFDFRMPNMLKGARDDVVRKYTQVQALIKDDRLDEALAILAQAQALTRLNFYERTMIAYAMALVYARHKDYLSAQEEIERATMHGGRDLDSRLLEPAIRIRVEMDLMNGELSGALRTFATLKTLDDFKPDDPLVQMVADARTRADALDHFAVKGRIPKAEDGDAWAHQLYRRDYTFANVEGKLERLQLSCDQQAIESPITETAEWHVPKNWSNCWLYVHGTPGTTFELIEAK